MPSDNETVYLVGGPADGDFITFDGGDWWEFEDLAGGGGISLLDPTTGFKELLVMKHRYKRDRRLETAQSGYPVFLYQGVA